MPTALPRSETSRKTEAAQKRARRDRATTPAAEKSRSRATLGYGLLGSGLLLLALPPFGLWPLAWVAPLPWLRLIELDRLLGRRPYLALWGAGCMFWLGALHWLRLPHPATSIGWLALSSYLGIYLPVFVALSRVAVRQFGVSILLAAPVVWTGLELAQAHLLTGINIATPGHSQFRWIALIQISDLCGGYGVSFVILLVAAVLARMLPLAGRRVTLWPLVPAAVVLAGVLAYGHYRMAGEHHRPGLKVALIQGSIDIEMKADRSQSDKIHEQYLGLTSQAVREHPDLDLIVWPETMFREALITYTPDVYPAADQDWTKEELFAKADEQKQLFADLAGHYKIPLLLGIDTIDLGPGEIDRHNSAMLLEPSGKITGRYDKMRPVMFGEYVPLGSYWPWLYRLTPLAEGVEPGAAPAVLTVRGIRIAPNICFETLLPHFIRGQVAELRAAGEEPDILANLTNDGWFWGSSELDLHLMCGIFRAVECRKPLVIAANTGFSAVIDADGRVLEQGPRRATATLYCDLPCDTRDSPYVRYGDWGAGLCLLAAVGLAVAGSWRRMADRRRVSAGRAVA